MGSSSGSAARAPNPWVIAIVVSIATFMEVLDTTIANVALRYIAGGLAVNTDEASWVVTTYLVSNAIVLTASPFLSKRYGRRAFYLGSLALFTASSIACGFSWNLGTLLIFRVLQGFAGGGMVPISQAILTDTFPPEKRGQANAVFGVAVVVAPVVGPVLGGWLSDNVSWHWCFLINGPIGAASFALVYFLVQEPKAAIAERRELKRRGVRFDKIGFALVATFLGALEVVLDRGQTDDWFGSTFIIVFAAICAAAFVLMIPWLLTHANPAIDLRLIGSRQFGSCFSAMLLFGALIIPITQFIPQILQDYYGYTATLAGWALTPGGMVDMAMIAISGQLVSRIQPRWMLAVASAIVAAAMYRLTSLYGDVDYWFYTWARMYAGLGLPAMFIAIQTAAFDGLKPQQTDQAAALVNAARNIGGSIGVSIAQNVLAYRQQFHTTRLVPHITPSDPQYYESLQRATDYFAARGASTVDAQRQATAWIGSQVASQAAYWSYIDVFFALMVIALAAIPVALAVRDVKLGEGSPGAA